MSSIQLVNSYFWTQSNREKGEELQKWKIKGNAGIQKECETEYNNTNNKCLYNLIQAGGDIVDFDITYASNMIGDLFNKAKEKDEFEFCCTLLRGRGKESAGWDSLFESYNLIKQTLSLISAPVDGLFKIRLLLLLYCHITEMNDFYSIVANLLLSIYDFCT